jgi:hypothetical protein
MAISDEHKNLIAKLLPVDVPADPCTECTPTVDGTNVQHSAICPVMLSVDSATIADRAWFEDHPYADHYYRPVTWGEAAQLAIMDDRVRHLAKSTLLTAMGRVRVERVNGDVRFRRFEEVYFVIQEVLTDAPEASDRSS